MDNLFSPTPYSPFADSKIQRVGSSSNLSIFNITFFFCCLDDYVFFPFLQVKERICKLIETSVDSGAKLVLDGRDLVVSVYCFCVVLIYMLLLLYSRILLDILCPWMICYNLYFLKFYMICTS